MDTGTLCKGWPGEKLNFTRDHSVKSQNFKNLENFQKVDFFQNFEKKSKKFILSTGVELSKFETQYRFRDLKSTPSKRTQIYHRGHLGGKLAKSEFDHGVKNP